MLQLAFVLFSDVTTVNKNISLLLKVYSLVVKYSFIQPHSEHFLYKLDVCDYV